MDLWPPKPEIVQQRPSTPAHISTEVIGHDFGKIILTEAVADELVSASEFSR